MKQIKNFGTRIKASPGFVLSVLVPDQDDNDNFKEFSDEDIVGVFRSVEGVHRAIKALMQYMELSNVFWDESLIKKETGLGNLLLEILARKLNVIKSNKADEIVITCRDIVKKKGIEMSQEELDKFGLSEEDIQDHSTFTATKRIYVKILICHTGKLFNLPE